MCIKRISKNNLSCMRVETHFVMLNMCASYENELLSNFTTVYTKVPSTNTYHAAA